ncbi:hypothetical protein BG261_02895 [Floricoccus tropicus]|uniref:Uncharacterized protein n=1 Tax=Floricoccus tropicus TaxID=1859473 RepID=A0A1E8GMT1_9LACT|nr:DUF1660 family phage protein [Floricoccus tropicus]OFI49542.1 hypothetical protein BG261_02895 [Floricoccus tropicus]
MKLLCKIFGHKLAFDPISDVRPYCSRCRYQNYALDIQFKNSVNNIMNSDLTRDEKLKEMRKAGSQLEDEIKKSFRL